MPRAQAAVNRGPRGQQREWIELSHKVLVNATDLVAWSDRIEARGLLPRLIRRLIQATTSEITRLEFRSGDGVQQPGFDGVVVVPKSSPYVPAGMSVWELSTSADIVSKASGDYEKRSEDPLGIDASNSTYVTVTSRRWRDKASWAQAREAEGTWDDVRALDADDLEAWLDRAPSVHIWLSRELDKYPSGGVDLDTWWSEWAGSATPSLPYELILAGRGESVEAVHNWMKGNSPDLIIRAESRDEALAFLVAAVRAMPTDERKSQEAVSVVVRTEETWRQLASEHKDLCLVRDFDTAVPSASVFGEGNRTIVPLGQADPSSASALELPRLSAEEATTALIASGIAEPAARALGALARRSVTALRRRLATDSLVAQPEWARPEHGRNLLPALMAGSWRHSRDADRAIVARLAEQEYDRVAEYLNLWAYEDDPPVRRIGDAWLLTAREDAWQLLGRYVDRNAIERFEAVIFEVLNVPDPRYDLPVQDRWLAAIRDAVPVSSAEIRRGLIESLAALATVVADNAGISETEAHGYVSSIVRRLLKQANRDWRIWASLSTWLPLLAEAAPDEFLNAVETGVAGDRPILQHMFTDSDSSLFTESPHTGLLWALERLAWSPDFLSRAAHLLARLAAIDPGGRLSNRPDRSLHEIFLPWHPGTSADSLLRLEVIDVLRTRTPDIAWALQYDLLPDSTGWSMGTNAPRWRDWKEEASDTVTIADYQSTVDEVLSRLLDDAANNPERWASLLDRYRWLNGDHRNQLIDRLNSVDVSTLRSPGAAPIWHALRELISHYRTYHKDDDEKLAEAESLEAMQTRFEPSNLIELHAWLFEAGHIALPTVGESNWEQQEAALKTARRSAVETLYAHFGLQGLMELALSAEAPHLVGGALASAGVLSEADVELIVGELASDVSQRDLLARGYVAARSQESGPSWARDLSQHADLSSSQRAALLQCLPSDRDTWDLASALGEEVERGYWQAVHSMSVRDPALIERAAEMLIANSRPRAAVFMLSMGLHRDAKVSRDVIVYALAESLVSDLDQDPLDNNFMSRAVDLLGILAESDEPKIREATAALEWSYLPLIHAREFEPVVLHQHLAENPMQFVELVKMLTGAKDSSDLLNAQARSQIAFTLLNSWRTLPGTSTDGSIDSEELKRWVDTVREALRDTDEQVRGDEMIGQLLSGSPTDEEGVWPHASVRDIVEDVASDNLERGIDVGRFNGRGMTMRRVYEGGEHEREAAASLRADASRIGVRWPRTAAMLRRMASQYEYHGTREDQEADLRQDMD